MRARVKVKESMNRSGKHPHDAGTLTSEIELIDERIALAKSQLVQRGKNWLRGIWITLGALVLLLGIDKVFLYYNAAGLIHRTLFGPKYEVPDSVLQASRSSLKALLSDLENRFFEFLEKSPLDTWSDSARTQIVTMRATRDTLLDSQQFFIGSSADEEVSNPKSFAARLERLGNCIDIIEDYREALSSEKQFKRQKFERLWEKARLTDEGPPTLRERATVAMLKSLVLRGYLLAPGARTNQQDTVKGLIALTVSLHTDEKSPILVARAKNLAGSLKATLADAQLKSVKGTPTALDIKEWVKGKVDAIDMFEQASNEGRGLLEMQGVFLNNSAHHTRLLLWKAGKEGWNIQTLITYEYPHVEEYMKTLPPGDGGSFDSYCKYMVEEHLMPDITRAVEYWSSNAIFVVTKVEIQILARAFATPGEFDNKTTRETDKELMADIKRALIWSKDAGYLRINTLKDDDVYQWIDKNKFRFSDGTGLFELLDKLSSQ